MICLHLPFPPSVNNWTRSAVIHGKVRVYKSHEHKAWVTQAGMAFVEQRSTRGSPIKGPFSAEIILDECKRGKIDMDNTLKATLDFAQRMNLIENDKLAEEICIRWSATPHGGCILYLFKAGEAAPSNVEASAA